MSSDLLTKAEVASRLGCSPSTLDRRIRTGTAPRPVNALGRPKFDPAAVEAFAAERVENSRRAAVTASLMADLIAPIEQDLLARFSEPPPAQRDLIESTAAVAAAVMRVERSGDATGWDERDATLFSSLIGTLTRGLLRLGSDRVAGSAAEKTLAKALVKEETLLAVRPPRGVA